MMQYVIKNHFLQSQRIIGDIMKIELRIEDDKPIIFFTDEIERDKTISCYCDNGQHAMASRAYMRSLKKPSTHEQMADCWWLINRYTSHVISNFSI